MKLPAAMITTTRKVLNDPAWDHIVEEAKRATEKLALLLSDPAEKTILTRAPIS